MRLMFIWAATLACGLAFASGKGNSNEQGSAQGQPFASINDTMAAMQDALEQQVAELGAATQNQVDCLNDYLNGTANAADPGECPDFSSSRIEDLQQELGALEQQVLTMSQEFASASCPEGATLTSLNPVTCTDDAAAAPAASVGQLLTTQAYGNSSYVYSQRSRTSTASCPAGYQVTGCSYLASPTINVYAITRDNASTGCSVSAYGFPGSGHLRALAQCATVGQ